jgi:peptidyl-prolyl cis-trans isomerase D
MKPGEISNLVESNSPTSSSCSRCAAAKKPRRGTCAGVEEVSKPKAQSCSPPRRAVATRLRTVRQPAAGIDKLNEAGGHCARGPCLATGARSAKLLDAVFSADAVKNKRNTEAVETGGNQLVSARIVEHHAERTLPLAEVRERVLAEVKAQQAAAAAKKDGEARVAALKANSGESLPQTQVLSRTKVEGQPRQVIDAVLRADITKGPAAIGVDLGEQGCVAARVPRVDREITARTTSARRSSRRRYRRQVGGLLRCAEAAAEGRRQGGAGGGGCRFRRLEMTGNPKGAPFRL